MTVGTLVEALRASVGLDAGITFLEGDDRPQRLLYQDLYQRALRILGELQRRGLQPGANLLLLLDGNAPLVDAFWACQLGGYVAVPINVGGTDEHQLKALNVLDQLATPTIVTQGRNPERLWEYARRNNVYDAFAATFQRELNLSQLAADGPLGDVHEATPSDVAYLQYSSGSTGAPKGVLLTHQSLLANIDAIISRTRMSTRDSHLSWVPLTHDLGMVMFHLLPLVLGVDQYLLPAQRFARRPLAWLRHASQTRASILCSPNFGYDHVLKTLAKTSPQDIDLSRVRVIFNGGEPISKDLCDAFHEKLAPFGLSNTAIRPAYGLAEACVAVAMTAPDTPVNVLRVDRRRLVVGESVVLNAAETAASSVVCVGAPVAHCEVCIADDAERPLCEQTYGHILVRGEIVTSGYYDETERRNPDDWLDTGDLGFMVDGMLYVCGRSKDAIIVNGVNYHPNDLERICHDEAGLEVGKVTCCGVTDPAGGERLAVFVTHRQGLDAFQPTVRAVRRAIGERAQLEATYVLPVRQMPKTTSGKIQRFKLAQALVDGEFANEIEALQPAGGARSAASRDTLELRLHGIFNAVLPDVELASEDNFVDFGVSSLSLAEISEAIDEEFPDALELDDYLEQQSIAELAILLGSRLEEKNNDQS